MKATVSALRVASVVSRMCPIVLAATDATPETLQAGVRNTAPRVRRLLDDLSMPTTAQGPQTRPRRPTLTPPQVDGAYLFASPSPHGPATGQARSHAPAKTVVP